jgi:membrane protease YdiL (CAAX protease family)
LSQSEQSPPLFGAEAIATGKLASVSTWSVIRDAAFDIAAVMGVLIAAGVVIGLFTIWQKTEQRQPVSPRVEVETLALTELSLLYFGFRRLRANRRAGVTLKLLEGNAWRGVMSGISIGIASIIFNVVYDIAVQKVFHLSSLPNPLQIFHEVKGNLLLSSALVLIISILAPTCEEFFFRANILVQHRRSIRQGPVRSWHLYYSLSRILALFNHPTTYCFR